MVKGTPTVVGAELMELSVYLPIVILVLATMAALFATAPDRNHQWHTMTAFFLKQFRRDTSGIKKTKLRFSVKRIVFSLIVLYLLSYGWTYQRVQDAIAVKLAENGVEEVAVGSLIIPYSAFFQSSYVANAGFSRSRKRTRVDVFIRGHLWGGFRTDIDEQGLAKINTVTGKKFVFSYLTDVKILRPVINQYMTQLVRGKQIDKYEIETFDNRGPYIIVALNPKNRSKEGTKIADSLAQGLYIHLTKTKQLKVNQVIIKVVDPEPYIADRIIKVIARGRAGSY